jgi:hypothetical protein
MMPYQALDGGTGGILPHVLEQESTGRSGHMRMNTEYGGQLAVLADGREQWFAAAVQTDLEADRQVADTLAELTSAIR